MNRDVCEHHTPVDLPCDKCHADEVTVAYMMGAQSKLRRLTDDQIGRIWFRLALPGVTETQARLIIREAEKTLRGEIQ